MMRRTSPPKHRHDGTSPLPLGMDWSPPPKKWNGRDTVWPHDPSTGWSYCVTVPSWIALPKSGSSASDPVVFYRIQVGVQSPQGITTVRGILRRFNDFLKLFADLKKAFPKKSISSAPPKGLLRMKSRALLEERRCSLEEWMTKLLSDIDISRSVVVASFLELEAAARSSFLEADHQISETNPPNSSISSHEFHASSSSTTLAGSSSVLSDYGSDTVYQTSEVETPSLGKDDSSDAGLEELLQYEELTNPMYDKLVKRMSNIDEGLLMGESILDHLEGRPRHSRMQARQIMDNGNNLGETSLAVDRLNSLFEVEPSNIDGHARKPSNESIESDMSSYRGSEVSNSWTANVLSEATIDLTAGPQGSRAVGTLVGPDSQLSNGPRLVLPVDQHSKLNKALVMMQRRLVTAKADMEDLITRLDQEIAVKDYLMTKVSDLEVELETTKQKNKENLQQALSIEKDRVTKMQWDMEEMRRKTLEMELKLQAQEVLLRADPASAPFFQEKDKLQGELEAARDQLNNLLKQHEALEMKSKSDIKVLVKEVKSLRKSQQELQQKLKQSVLEKSAAEQLLQKEKVRNEEALMTRRNLLHDCEILHSQLQECDINFVKGDNLLVDFSALDDAMNLIAKSDDQITLILEKVQGFVEFDHDTVSSADNYDELRRVDDELRKILGAITADNGKLRNQVNSLMRSALQKGSSAPEVNNSEESTSVGTITTESLET